LGLEFLKKKEEFGKEIYSEFSKGMLSNVYNTESLKNDNQNSEEEIIECNNSIADAKTKIKDVDNRLKKGQDYKDNLLKSKFTDLDQDLVILNLDRLQIQIEEHKTISGRLKSQMQEIKIVEPKKFYHEDQHDSVREKIKSTNGELVLAENKVEEIEDLIKKYGDGIQCEHCGIKLMEAELTKKKIEQLEKYKKLVKEFKKELESLEKKEQSFTQLKKDFDEYEKAKLVKEKYEASLEANDLKLEQFQDKMKRYLEVQDKIKKNNEIDAQLVKAGLRLDELIKEKRDYEKVQTTNQNQITFLEERIEKNNELILKIAEEYEKEKVYKIYLDIFGKNGISKIIMKTMMPLINQELQRLLIDSCYFNLEIRINEKNEVEFVMIDNSTGIEKLMVSGSGYERTIAAMALRAVLSKVCSLPKPNVIVWDEVFGKISNDNLDMVGEFFQKMREYFEKIFVISHNPLINAWGNNTLKISKSDNVSRVIQ
jgi:DNA repair exonuclease SbcCD ATPase subunit